MAYSKCKRMEVHAWGMNKLGTVVRGRNGNLTKCTEEVGNCGCIHAEMGVLKKMPNPEIIVTSHAPCKMCAIALVEAGVKAVYFLKDYRLTEGRDYLVAHGVYVYKMRADSVVEFVGEGAPDADR